MSAYSITTRGLDGRKVPQGTLTTMGALLFGSSEQGPWYDPSDLSTMFQDSAGTTPVTAVEQPVGRILDKSQGLVRGAETVTNGSFADATGWTLGSGWTIGGGVAVSTMSGILSSTTTMVAGKTYEITLDITAYTSGGIQIRFGGASAGYLPMSVGSKRIIAVSSGGLLEFVATTLVCSISNISVRELPGNHATQPTSPKRPTYSRRVNLLTKTEDFAAAAWVKSGLGTGTTPVVTVNDAIAPNGTMTADRIDLVLGGGTGSSDWSWIYQSYSRPAAAAEKFYVWLKAATPADVGRAIRVSYGATSAVVTLTADWAVHEQSSTGLSGSYGFRLRGSELAGAAPVSFYAWGASLTLDIDNHIPYQWVNTATDYDADPTKFPAYLAFDGVNRALATGNIDFTSTDKMTVWAGVTRLTSSGSGIIAELSTSSTSTNGSWRIADLRADGSFGSSQSFGSRGTILVGVNAATIGGPANTVLTGAADIGAGTLAASGFIGAPVAANQGTGNYGNYPLYIGARAGTSLYFNGRLYGLIVRGAQSTLSQTEAAELYMRKKVGTV